MENRWSRLAGTIAVAWAAACARTPPATHAIPAPAAPAQGPRWSASSELEPPVDYRSWVFLTSGFAMSYGPAAQAALAGGVDVLDNVYVSPAAYRSFMGSGVWPDETMFVLEIRTAEETGSIVTRGRFQTELVGVEAAVKDTRRFSGGWGYFGFRTDSRGPTQSAAVLPRTASCYDCHTSHGAVEQTFTQFYPTLFAVAREKGTVRSDFPGLPPSGTELEARIVTGGWPAGQALLETATARWPQATVLRESTLTRVGRGLRRGNRGGEALAVFEEITRRFPSSAAAWNNLSEAYEASGAAEKAREALDRGLTVVATDQALPPDRRGSLERSLRERKKRLQR